MGLYYLQSRYYDPEVGRFINGDAYAATGQGLLSNNMYVYCLNNPVYFVDPSGHLAWPTWEDVEDWLKDAFDAGVQGTLETFDPLGSRIAKKLHYSRNELNNMPQTEGNAVKAGYVKVAESDDKFHQNNQNSGRNRKYISSDGHSEAVYYSNGKLNDTPEDQGTYNVFSANGNVFERYLGHGIFDVLPYMLWGNSPEDDTTIVDRIIMIFR